MLQQEHQKAQKKIQETAKKTDELIGLRQKNDEEFQRQQENNMKREQQAKNSSQYAYQEQKMRRQQVNDAKFNMYMTKKQGVQAVREQLREDALRKEQFNRQEEEQKAQRREGIKSMIAKSKHSVENYRQAKIEQSKSETQAKIDYEKRLIYKYEKEAQELESAEEALIKRLQEIQEEERQAFMELEQSMITASLAKKDRLEIVNEVNDEHNQAREQYEMEEGK